MSNYIPNYLPWKSQILCTWEIISWDNYYNYNYCIPTFVPILIISQLYSHLLCLKSPYLSPAPWFLQVRRRGWRQGLRHGFPCRANARPQAGRASDPLENGGLNGISWEKYWIQRIYPFRNGGYFFFHITFFRGVGIPPTSFRNGGLLGLNGTLNGELNILENHQAWLGNLWTINAVKWRLEWKTHYKWWMFFPLWCLITG